MYQSIMFFIK